MIIGQFIIRSMQNQLDILMTATNKIALSLSLKQHSINEELIKSEGRSAYALQIPYSHNSFRGSSGLDGYYNTNEEQSLCNVALRMVETSIKLAQLFQRKSKLHLDKFLQPAQLDSQKIPSFKCQNFQEFQIHDKNSLDKIRSYILANYQNSPEKISVMAKAFRLNRRQVEKWIQNHEKKERKNLLREQLIIKTALKPLSLSQFKCLAKKIYKSKQFRAGDAWCITYLKANDLTELVELPKRLNQ